MPNIFNNTHAFFAHHISSAHFSNLLIFKKMIMKHKFLVGVQFDQALIVVLFIKILWLQRGFQQPAPDRCKSPQEFPQPTVKCHGRYLLSVDGASLSRHDEPFQPDRTSRECSQ